MFWASLSLCIVGAVIATPVSETKVESIEIKDDKSKTFEVEEAGANRQEKLFSVFQIVRFNNEECEGSDGNKGTCYTAAECSAKSGGTAKGSCAQGFGVCCVIALNPCQGTTNAVTSTLTFDVANKPSECTTDNTDTSSSTKRRSSYRRKGRGSGPGEYDYLIQKANSAIVQLRLDFIKVELALPDMGACTNDSIIIEHADKATELTLPMELCGILTDQHMYLGFREEDEIDVRFLLGDEVAQNWQVLVRQLEETDDLYAPRGCLQYYFTSTGSTAATSGNIHSFNNNGGQGEMLNDQRYTICIEQNNDYCDMELMSTDFDLSGSNGNCADSIAFGTTCMCGSTFGTNSMLTWNYTGSYHIDVFSDAMNTAMNSGFNINWSLLTC